VDGDSAGEFLINTKNLLPNLMEAVLAGNRESYPALINQVRASCQEAGQSPLQYPSSSL
jgi:hypothetical protein